MADEKVRHFQLRNSENNTMDLLELHHFAYSPTGLGVEMSNSYFPSYGSFLPEKMEIKQNVIKLSILYGYGTNKPYKDYRDLINFINKTPLTLAYAYPDSEDDGFYIRDVIVQSITKEELDNSLGFLKSDLSLEALTPWYQYVPYVQRGSSKPLKPGKMYADANWGTVQNTGSTVDTWVVPSGKTRSYTINGRDTYRVTTQNQNLTIGDSCGSLARDVSNKKVRFYGVISAEKVSSGVLPTQIGIFISGIAQDGVRFQQTVYATAPTTSKTTYMNALVDFTGFVFGDDLSVFIFANNNSSPTAGGSIYNISFFHVLDAGISDVGFANTAEGVLVPGHPINETDDENTPSYPYPYSYQANPGATSKSVILTNDSVYLGYQPDSALVVTVTASQGTGVISNPGWILYDQKNNIIQQERILIDIPLGATLRVNSDYKDREVTLIEGDINQTSTDVADHIDPTVRGFIRVPIGVYRLQLDDATFNQVGGFNLGAIGVYLKKEWLVV
jgi:hypothetical protein